MYKNFYASYMRSGTDGFQQKFLVDSYFVKTQCVLQRVLRDDWMVEIIASKLCEHFKIYHVEQKPCRVNILRNDVYYERMGVYSNNFELKGLHFVSAERLFNKYSDSINVKSYIQLDSVNKIYYLCERISKYSNIDYMEVLNYLFNLVFIDILVLNQDRHIHNFGVFWDSKESKYQIAKVFDCGMGLFENDNLFDGCTNLEDCLRYSYLEPFGDGPFELLEMLLSDKSFKLFLDNKRKYGKCSLLKNQFSNSMSWIYFSKIRKEMGV